MTYAEHLRQEGMQQGMQQGIERASLEIAKSLLQAGVDKNIIKQTTHLTDEQLSELCIK